MTGSAARPTRRFAALLAAALGFALGAGVPASADDRRDGRDDQHKLGKRVIQLPKTGERCADDPKCHNRWHHAIPAVEKAKSGDVVVFGTRDAFDHSLDRNSTAADVVALNLNLVHPLTGPLCVERCAARATCSPSLCSISSRTSSATRSSCRASDSCATCSRTRSSLAGI